MFSLASERVGGTEKKKARRHAITLQQPQGDVEILFKPAKSCTPPHLVSIQAAHDIRHSVLQHRFPLRADHAAGERWEIGGGQVELGWGNLDLGQWHRSLKQKRDTHVQDDARSRSSLRVHDLGTRHTHCGTIIVPPSPRPSVGWPSEGGKASTNLSTPPCTHVHTAIGLQRLFDAVEKILVKIVNDEFQRKRKTKKIVARQIFPVK